jgi:hypothetical protein
MSRIIAVKLGNIPSQQRKQDSALRLQNPEVHCRIVGLFVPWNLAGTSPDIAWKKVQRGYLATLMSVIRHLGDLVLANASYLAPSMAAAN